jgi:hypothetical protein
MKTFIFASILAFISGQAHALSCLRPDPIATFQQLAAEPESYFVLYGTLTFDERALPQGNNSFENITPPDPIPARFEGKGLSKAGFATPYISRATLQVTCAGPWCGSARSGAQAIYFVPASDPPVTMQASACGGMVFEDPTPDVLEMLTSCMQGGTCTPLSFE